MVNATCPLPRPTDAFDDYEIIVALKVATRVKPSKNGRGFRDCWLQVPTDSHTHATKQQKKKCFKLPIHISNSSF